jgi:APA family basic amino acid/polyamine antiporter
LNPRTAIIGAGWMLVGLAVYLLYRRANKLPLTETVKVLLPEPLGVAEVEYESVLVAIDDGDPFSQETMATAVKLAAKRRRAIHVAAIMTVPSNLPLDAPLERQEGEAQSKIEQAKLVGGGLRVDGHVHPVRPNQAGRSIADEAREMKASAIVMGLRYRNGQPLYGKTLQTVLADRPCRVILVGEPGRARAGGDGGPPSGIEVPA